MVRSTDRLDMTIAVSLNIFIDKFDTALGLGHKFSQP